MHKESPADICGASLFCLDGYRFNSEEPVNELTTMGLSVFTLHVPLVAEFFSSEVSGELVATDSKPFVHQLGGYFEVELNTE